MKWCRIINKPDYLSFYFSVIILFLCILFIISSLYFSNWVNSRQINRIITKLINEINYLRDNHNDNHNQNYEIKYCGSSKLCKWWRYLYSAFFLLHRLLIVMGLAITHPKPIYKIVGFITFQLIYIVYLLSCRPLLTAFWTNMKIYREICILILIAFMISLEYCSDEVLFYFC